MKGSFSFALLFVAAAGAQAGTPHRFFEVSGYREFSGRMIARPLQIVRLMQNGKSYDEAVKIQDKARADVDNLTLSYVPETDEYILHVAGGSDENTISKRLMATGEFQYVEPDWIVYPQRDPNDTRFPEQWNLHKINAQPAWDLFTGSPAVTIALTDTGVRLDHEDLAANLVSGYNAVDGIAQSDGGQVNDLNGHGTHTAGIAGAVGNNGRGVSGVGWNFHIMEIRVSNSSGGSSSISILTSGARWAADHGARVISTSYSGVDSSGIQTTGDYIKHVRNGIYCYAAGNDGRNLPTDEPDVTIVGATDSDDSRAGFSAFGHAVDLFAPGVNILSTYAGSSSDYQTLSGTSMATPCAAGVAGMIISANPGLGAQAVEDILYHSCHDLGTTGRDDTWGWGRVDVNAALRQVYNTSTFGPTAYSLIRGTYVSGGLAELQSADGSELDLSVGLTSLRGNVIQVTFDTATTISTIGQLDFNLKSRVTSPSVDQKIELYDFAANAYVLVDDRVASQSNSLVTVPAANPARFQGSGGLLRARITYQANVLFSVSPIVHALVDFVGWRTAP